MQFVSACRNVSYRMLVKRLGVRKGETVFTNGGMVNPSVRISDRKSIADPAARRDDFPTTKELSNFRHPWLGNGPTEDLG
jgi:hypothetical protein